jgi:hypothetical protein
MASKLTRQSVNPSLASDYSYNKHLPVITYRDLHYLPTDMSQRKREASSALTKLFHSADKIGQESNEQELETWGYQRQTA